MQEDRRQEAVRPWIRGVNIGGWLLMERFITPYMFAVTKCHLAGDFCWYPGQLSAPPTSSPHHEYCDLFQCEPHMIDSADGGKDFPTDEYTLAQSFPNKALAREYLNYHWENFVQKQDVIALKEAGVTHVRVPIPHWIMGDIKEDEPWVDGQWLHFVRFVGWCRELSIEVWPDIHTAPGSQNGFDNSGQLLPDRTCKYWSGNAENVKRSLRAVDDITKAIARDSIKDVVSGFGVLNEPFGDCDPDVVRTFYDDALKIVKTNIGHDTNVFIGDMFNASKFNDGFWIDADDYSNTFLDSHYYHVFAERPRSLSPKQHIAYVCAKNTRDTEACCYSDHPTNQKPSKGISRLIGEWSASYDTLVVDKLADVMEGIKKNGEAPEFNRTIPEKRQDFLKEFVKAQMVAYEAEDAGVSSGWFYWTLKTEGGAFAEWSFLRGLKEKWIPSIPDPGESSMSLFGSCRDIAERTVDDETIVHEFPDPETTPEGANWQGVEIDDDYVVTHAGSLTTGGKSTTSTASEHDDQKSSKTSSTTTSVTKKNQVEIGKEASTPTEATDEDMAEKDSTSGGSGWFPLFAVVFFVYAIWRVFFKNEPIRGIGGVGGLRRGQYSNIDAPSALSV
mmetsp:Transcript_29456/g.45350  ORF Transcript_29456/g.45350 Transcript_29456/m.45350 type:complete len:615 (-) Transcript_29456:169-2013(-)